MYYVEHGRHELPWRLALDPYSIVVSELMLQQTQVGRVIPKYQAFIGRFPGFASLAAASLGDVLSAWQGLGYNRRAKFLWQTAEQVVGQHHGRLPGTLEELVQLPGIGVNTAGAVLAYAFNKPALFIETNVRTVYIHEFFGGQEVVSDKEIREFLAQTLDYHNPRDFYWAMMDYGTHLKQTAGNHGARSKHYVRQSPFEGSRRQLRGAIIRLLAQGDQTVEAIGITLSDARTQSVLNDLVRESMILQTGDTYHLA